MAKEDREWAYRIVIFPSKQEALKGMDDDRKAFIHAIAVFSQIWPRDNYHVGVHTDVPLTPPEGWTEAKVHRKYPYIEYETNLKNKEDVVKVLQKQFPNDSKVIDKEQKK